MQLPIDFEPGLTEQFESFDDVLVAVVYGGPSGLKRCAGRCDVSPSMLSRMLSKTEGRALPSRFAPLIIDEMRDYRPVYWLIEKFLHSPSDNDAALMHELRVFLRKGQTLIDRAMSAPAKARASK